MAGFGPVPAPGLVGKRNSPNGFGIDIRRIFYRFFGVSLSVIESDKSVNCRCFPDSCLWWGI